MKKPEFPSNEIERLKSLSLHDFENIDGVEEFDFLTALAADVCGCEISLISLIFADKQWFLSNHGLAVKETPRDYAFCAHAIHEPDAAFVVENALEDERFFDNPLVVGDPNIRFYTGIPILDGGGLALGTLCVIDQKPKQLDENQTNTLRRLANQVHRLFELRRMRLGEQKRLSESEMNLTLLQDSQVFNKIGAWQLNIATSELLWTDMVYQIHEMDLSFEPTVEKALNFYHPDDLPILMRAFYECFTNGTPFNVECRLITFSGKLIWVRSSGKKQGDKIIGSFQDITQIKENELKFKMMINSSSSLLIVLDITGRIVEMNNVAIELSMMSRNQFIGKNFLACNYWGISVEWEDLLTRKFHDALSGLESSEELVFWLDAAHPFTVLFNTKPVFDESDSVTFVIVEAIPIQEIVDERNRNKFILEGANVATGQWNVAANEIIFDAKWSALIGLTLEETQPMTLEKWMSFYHPDDLIRSKEMLRKVFENETEFFDLEARLRHKEGHWVWIQDKGKVVQRNQEGKPITMYGIHLDITERKSRELKLAYQENILDALFRDSPFGIVLSDLETGAFLDANDAFLSNVRYQKSEFLMLNYTNFSSDYNPVFSSKDMAGFIDGKAFDPLERDFDRKDGSKFTAVVRGIPIKDSNDKFLLWSFVQDVSKEKESEQKLKDALLRLQTVLNTSTNVAFIATNKEGEIALFNTGAEQLLGYSHDEIVGKATPLLFHETEEIQERQAYFLNHYGANIEGFDIFTFKANQGFVDTRQWTYIRKDLAKVTVLLSIAAIVEKEEVVGYLGAATDISEIKKNEEEIRVLLKLTQKQNERLENFARIVSHNLKNHSDGILGILEVLREKNPELANNKFLSLFEKSANNLVDTIGYLIEEKLLKSKLVNLELEPVDIGLIIQKNLISLAGSIFNVNMEVDNELELGRLVLGVPAYIDSAVLNILSNAMKYRDPMKKAHLKIQMSFENDFSVLEFIDNGLGIDLDKHKNEVFTLNKTFHNNIDSRGIGLFITRNQIEQMGGKIEVDSVLHKGSTFRIFLPTA